MKQIQRAKQKNVLVNATPNGARTRRYYIFNESIVNKEECISQGRRSLQQNDYDFVEVHMHGTGDQCLGVYTFDQDGKCFRFGKGKK